MDFILKLVMLVFVVSVVVVLLGLLIEEWFDYFWNRWVSRK